MGGNVLVVVIGAGASYDAVEKMDDNSRPPLTKDFVKTTHALVNRVLNDYPGAHEVADFLRERLPPEDESREALQGPTTTLEEALQQYEEEVKTRYAEGHLIEFRWYLRQLLLECGHRVRQAAGGPTNYTRLVRRCLVWADKTSSEVHFVSLNYDTLLDQALTDGTNRDFDLLNLDSYVVEGRPFSLVKPHGSAAWVETEFGDIEAHLTPQLRDLRSEF